MLHILLLLTVLCVLAIASRAQASGSGTCTEDLEALGAVAREIVAGSKLPAGASIPGHVNTTPWSLVMPGANAGYPAFWVRDAAMMSGAGLADAAEIEGWVRLTALVQAGPLGDSRANGLTIPPYSIPDHITFTGQPCWYPGAYAGHDQGNGTYGHLPPADDAFWFIQLVRRQVALSGSTAFFLSGLQTSYSDSEPLQSVCRKAFDSVEAEEGAVVCSAEPGRTRVDWGFCDAIHKTGRCLMPTLLRWQAAVDMADLFELCANDEQQKYFLEQADVSRHAVTQFLREGSEGRSWLVSTSDLGCQPDVWASAYAVWLGALDQDDAARVSKWLLGLYRGGGVVQEGQVRHLPDGQYWKGATVPPDTYQNGAYWGTPAGWFIHAIAQLDPSAARQMLGQYVQHIRKHRKEGAPWECIFGATGYRRNDLYGASAALPYSSLTERPATVKRLETAGAGQ